MYRIVSFVNTGLLTSTWFHSVIWKIKEKRTSSLQYRVGLAYLGQATALKRRKIGKTFIEQNRIICNNGGEWSNVEYHFLFQMSFFQNKPRQVKHIYGYSVFGISVYARSNSNIIFRKLASEIKLQLHYYYINAFQSIAACLNTITLEFTLS